MISVSQADEQSTFFRYWIFTYIKKQEELEMKSYEEMTKEELLKEKEGLEAEYKKFQQRGLKLDMSRGKPSQEQLDLSMGMMDVLTSGVDLTCDDGTDCRNYGVLDGISEAKQLIGDMIECNPDNIIIYGNSSLNIMYDTISRSMTHGVMGNTPWCKLDKVKFLCPVPGYDRHFAITEYFGIEMINVPMLPTGPDMDMVEDLVSKDEAIKGIWCVPKYSNPQGITYSDETVRRFARLKPAAKDFRIYWDNAYCVHHLYDINQDHLIEILKECKRAGNPDMVYKFCSTSKITFPGSGVAAIATSANNLEDIKKQLKIQTIGHDKVNQLRHVRFFKDIHGITEHMRKHADSLRPKFEMILDTFERELKGLGAGSWYSPKGGYFITYETLDGCAKNVVAKAKKADMKTLVDIMDNVFPMISTSLSKSDIVSLGMNMLSYQLGDTCGFPFEHRTSDLSGDSEVPVTLSWNVTRLHDYLFGIKDYEPSAGVQERSAHIEEVSGFSKGSAVSKENYTLNGEEAGKDVDDNIPGIQETESETETQTQEAAVSDNGDGSVYDDNSYDQEQYNDYSPDGYNYDEEY